MDGSGGWTSVKAGEDVDVKRPIRKPRFFGSELVERGRVVTEDAGDEKDEFETELELEPVKLVVVDP